MSNRAIFRLAVIGILIFDLASGGIITFFDDGSLDAAWELLPETFDWNSLIEEYLVLTISILAIILVMSILSLVGVVLFKAWGRWLYLTVTLLIFPFSIIAGPVINYGWETALFDFANMFHGAIILSMFLQPIASEFKSSDKAAW